MSNSITCRIDPNEFMSSGLPLDGEAYELWLMGKLRDSGIPIKGRDSFQGVTSGILSNSDPDQTGHIIFRWVA